MSAADQRPEPTLADVLGGRGGAVDATVPVVVFVAAFVLGDALGWPSVVAWAGGAAVLAAVVVGGVRLAGGRRPRAVLLRVLGVAGAPRRAPPPPPRGGVFLWWSFPKEAPAPGRGGGLPRPRA